MNAPNPALAASGAGAERVLIFLDVDGVLNSFRSLVAYGGFKTEHLDPLAVRYLGRLCRDLDARGMAPEVVISSTWRIKHPEKSWWLSFFESHDCGHIRVTGCTPYFRDNEPNRRGREIAAWVAKNAPGCRYVCFDDDSDFLPDQPLVLTRFEDGLLPEHVDAAHLFLTGEPMPGLPRFFDPKITVEPLPVADGAGHGTASGSGDDAVPGTNPSPSQKMEE